jgi:phosphohistidine phosphatase SixA
MQAGLVIPEVRAEITLEEASEQTPEALIKVLQEGGFVIYMRHASTEHDQMDQDLANIQDCSTQRNLSVDGREQAKNIGKAFQGLGIPVGEVQSSPYCRCRDTAQLAFGEYKINPALYFTLGAGPKETVEKAAELRMMLTTLPTSGTNTVLVSHTSNLKEAVGIWPKPEGVTVIFRPLEDGRVLYYGMIPSDQWEHMVRLKGLE